MVVKNYMSIPFYIRRRGGSRNAIVRLGNHEEERNPPLPDSQSQSWASRTRQNRTSVSPSGDSHG